MSKNVCKVQLLVILGLKLEKSRTKLFSTYYRYYILISFDIENNVKDIKVGKLSGSSISCYQKFQTSISPILVFICSRSNCSYLYILIKGIKSSLTICIRIIIAALND